MKQILVKNGNKNRMTWTDEDLRIKPGNNIRFKDEKDWWEIREIYDVSIQKNEINRTWRVGGL